ncbi:IQ motif and SEC7 domain containing protein [Gracilaria domingensis]|nr:IQ motif and SEC7 domain containing protein [Gracilaria domingensis]
MDVGRSERDLHTRVRTLVVLTLRCWRLYKKIVPYYGPSSCTVGMFTTTISQHANNNSTRGGHLSQLPLAYFAELTREWKTSLYCERSDEDEAAEVRWLAVRVGEHPLDERGRRKDAAGGRGAAVGRVECASV